MTRKMPTARAGNYRAPVDTIGMDPEMKETLHIGPAVKPEKPTPLQKLLSKFTKKNKK